MDPFFYLRTPQGIENILNNFNNLPQGERQRLFQQAADCNALRIALPMLFEQNGIQDEDHSDEENEENQPNENEENQPNEWNEYENNLQYQLVQNQENVPNNNQVVVEQLTEAQRQQKRNIRLNTLMKKCDRMSQYIDEHGLQNDEILTNDVVNDMLRYINRRND